MANTAHGGREFPLSRGRRGPQTRKKQIQLRWSIKSPLGTGGSAGPPEAPLCGENKARRGSYLLQGLPQEVMLRLTGGIAPGLGEEGRRGHCIDRGRGASPHQLPPAKKKQAPSGEGAGCV